MIVLDSGHLEGQWEAFAQRIVQQGILEHAAEKYGLFLPCGVRHDQTAPESARILGHQALEHYVWMHLRRNYRTNACELDGTFANRDRVFAK